MNLEEGLSTIKKDQKIGVMNMSNLLPCANNLTCSEKLHHNTKEKEKCPK